MKRLELESGGCTLLWIIGCYWVVYFKRINFTFYECYFNKRRGYDGGFCLEVVGFGEDFGSVLLRRAIG